MKIVVLGTRGFPNVQGGVEKHCENLYPKLVKLGCEVVVLGRMPYIGKESYEYKGVKVSPLPCPRNKFLEAFVHTFQGVFAAKKLNPDILHIHAVGPAIMVSLAKLLGMRVVFTHHGPDYERKKWHWLAKFVLKLGESFGCKFANAVICISRTIADAVKAKYKRDAIIIPNGVVILEKLNSFDSLDKYSLQRGNYVLAVGRFVPEKGFHDLVEAFKIASSPSAPLNDMGWKLVIVGDADHEDAYSRQLKSRAKETPGVVLTGFLSGKPLAELYSNAGLFILPSYYEGLPIVLLEAMSYGLSCIVSDIPANREVGLEDARYFKPGDVEGMAKKVQEFIAKPMSVEEKQRQVEVVKAKYDWGVIAQKTIEVYKQVTRSQSHRVKLL